MREVNGAAREIDVATDMLSFCFQENFVRFDVGDHYNLGDMLIDVDYVRRKC